MGVPRFFKWFTERYPCIISPFNASIMPSVDNLYLDMNGIIHNCARSDDKTSKRPSEKQMMLNIFQYIDNLVAMIQPKKHLFMAIDGVAPRAKMNQQRSRRFRSAFEAKSAREEQRKQGIPVPDDTFDSNAITPGTEFMANLSEHLQYLVRRKIEQDIHWQQCKVIISGHDVPGEGEHKIMCFIRNRKMTEKNYSANETHCLYGLDADLIMLGLVTHEPHFMLLREDVSHQYIRKVNKTNVGDNDPIKKKFNLLHLSLVRDYLNLDFAPVFKKYSDVMKMDYDLERVIDDFVVICFLCGNDFLPHMATLDIRDGAMGLLLDIYKRLLPELDGYLTKDGQINFDRMEQFIAQVATHEESMLQTRLNGLMSKKKNRGLVRKHQRKKKITKIVEETTDHPSPLKMLDASTLEQQVLRSREADHLNDTSDVIDRVLHGQQNYERNGIGLEQMMQEQQQLLDAEKGQLSESDAAFSSVMMTTVEVERDISIDPTMPFDSVEAAFVDGDEDDDIDDSSLDLLLRAQKKDGSGLNFSQWYRLYYASKLDIDISRDPMKKEEVVIAYVEGLKWIYSYYYNGCVSWKWFYPFHYAPICTDLFNLKAISDRIHFTLDAPFHPFEQLLGVLPPESNELLPAALRPLLLSKQSPIADFYPERFEIDREGTRYDYEGVVLLPFIDEDRLRKAMRCIEPSRFSQKEVKRNQFVEETLLEYVPPDKASAFQPYTFPSTLPSDMPDIKNCHVRATSTKASDFQPPAVTFLPRLCKGVSLGPNSPEGFPSLQSKVIESATLENVGLRLFGHPSKWPSMCIAVGNGGSKDRKSQSTSQLSAQAVKRMVGTRVYIGYPFARLAQVTSLSDEKVSCYGKDDPPSFHSDDDKRSFVSEAKRHQETLKDQYALDIGQVDVLLFVQLFNGMKKIANGSIVKSFTEEEFAFPYQLLVDNYSPIADPKFQSRRTDLLKMGYPRGTDVIPLSSSHPNQKHFVGEKCVVLGTDREGKNLRIGLEREKSGASSDQEAMWYRRDALPSLVPKEVHDFSHQKYYSLGVAGKKLGMSSKNLGLITGRLNITDHNGKSVNVGLNLRDTRENKRVIGYMRHDNSNQTIDESYFLNFSRQNANAINPFSMESNNPWKVSDKAIELIDSYKKSFPELFESLSSNGDVKLMKIYNGEKNRCESKMKELRKWLDSQEYRHLPFLNSSADLLPEHLIKSLEQAFVDAETSHSNGHVSDQQLAKQSTTAIEPSRVHRPTDPFPTGLPYFSRDSYRIGDHVVHISGSSQAPFGFNGILVGIEGPNANVVFPVEFVGGSTLNQKLHTFRGQTLALSSLLNLSAMKRHYRDKSNGNARKPRLATQRTEQLQENYKSHYYTVDRYSQRPPTTAPKPDASQRTTSGMKDYASKYKSQPNHKQHPLKKSQIHRTKNVAVQNVFSSLSLEDQAQEKQEQTRPQVLSRSTRTSSSRSVSNNPASSLSENAMDNPEKFFRMAADAQRKQRTSVRKDANGQLRVSGVMTEEEILEKFSPQQ